MVELLAAAGVATVVVARRRDRLDEIAARLPRVEVLAADLTTADGLAAVEERIAAGGKAMVDLVVNNAGFGTSGEFHLLDADRLEQEVQLNVIALTRLSRAALGAMVPRGRGYLLNVSSVASFQPAPTPGRLRGHQGLRHQPHREPARRGQRHRRARHRAVPGPHPHRVPERQQHRELRHQVPGPCLDGRPRCRSHRSRRRGEGSGVVGAGVVVQGNVDRRRGCPALLDEASSAVSCRGAEPHRPQAGAQ